MSGFEYSALDAGGREKHGVIEADTERHARTLLRERGLAPLTVQSTRESAEKTGLRERFSRPAASSALYSKPDMPGVPAGGLLATHAQHFL